MSAPTDESILPAGLVDQVRTGQCLLFVSPEVSIHSDNLLGPPGDFMLALELALELGERLDDYSLPLISQAYVDRNDLEGLQQLVAGRLKDPRYRPTRAHYRIAQLPFQFIISTAQDGLLVESFDRLGIPVTHSLWNDFQNPANGRVVIELYGTSSQPKSLLLTEDQRKEIKQHSPDLVDTLCQRTESQPLLFLGYAPKDRFFREFYQWLQPSSSSNSPPAYIVQEVLDDDDLRYWKRKGAVLIRQGAFPFLDSLAETLIAQGDPLPSFEEVYEEPPLLSDEQQSRKEKKIIEFSRLLGLNRPVENRDQLQPVSSGLALLRRTLSAGKLAAGDQITQSVNISGEAGAVTVVGKVTFQQGFEQLGNIEWAEGNYERAREYFERVTDKASEITDAHLSLYYLLVGMDKLDDALDVYNEIIGQDPKQAFLPERFRITGVLGQSDVGIGYCVSTHKDEKQLTVTILRRALAHQTEDLERFVADVEKVHSPRISRLLGHDRYGGRSYLITEYVEGCTLREHLRSHESLPLPEVMPIIDQVAEALEDGISQGVPHLELQPAYIVLGQQGAVLVYYGFYRLKRLLSQAGRLAPERRTEYEAPEQRAGKMGDERSDVYALATILYEILMGRLPGEGKFQPVSESYPQHGDAFDILISRAREVDPERRFRSVSEFRIELQRIVLLTRDRWPGQALRQFLARMSKLYAGLFSRSGLLFLSVLLLTFIVIEMANEGLPSLVRGASRQFLILVFHSSLAGSAGYYLVREIARKQGLGSLLASGRALGASLGIFFSIWLMRIISWGDTEFTALAVPDFFSILFLTLITVLFMVYISIHLLDYIGLQFEKRFRHYTLGFYGAFIVLSIAFLLLALIRQPFGFFTWD